MTGHRRRIYPRPDMTPVGERFRTRRQNLNYAVEDVANQIPEWTPERVRELEGMEILDAIDFGRYTSALLALEKARWER